MVQSKLALWVFHAVQNLLYHFGELCVFIGLSKRAVADLHLSSAILAMTNAGIDFSFQFSGWQSGSVDKVDFPVTVLWH